MPGSRIRGLERVPLTEVPLDLDTLPHLLRSTGFESPVE